MLKSAPLLLALLLASNMAGNLNDTSDVTYGVELGMSAMGFDLTITMDEAGARSALKLLWVL